MKNKKFKLFSIFLLLLFSAFGILFLLEKNTIKIQLQDKNLDYEAYSLVEKKSLIDKLDKDGSDFDNLNIYLSNDDFEEFNIETELDKIYASYQLELQDSSLVPLGKDVKVRYEALKKDKTTQANLKAKLDFNPKITVLGPYDKVLEQDRVSLSKDFDLEDFQFQGSYLIFESHEIKIKLDQVGDPVDFTNPGSYPLTLYKEDLNFEKEITIVVEENIDVHDPDNTGTADLSRLDVLVNKHYHLDEKDVPPLKTIPANYSSVDGNQAQPQAVDAFIELVDTMKEETGDIVLAYSTYRSYSYQVGLFNTFAEREGVEAANKFSARAGQSEHQTGLAIDVVKPGLFMDDFGTSEESLWVSDNAHRFGFIIRFPEGKEAITGYTYEPWHLRYLGKDLAQKVLDSGLTYDEYWLKYIRGS